MSGSPQLRVMVQGTASGVGKSWIATGLCRLYARQGLRVVPFKAQNLSNNSAPAASPRGWGEIGRAQAAQAEAAGIPPTVDMNPVLLKPSGDQGAQIIVGGHPIGDTGGLSSDARRALLWEAVQAAWARVSAEADVVVLEGAGSPAEINLRQTDIVNMAMARHADARVLLVGDIDRGGVFASLYGTLALLEERDRPRVAGLVINRFRGDPSLLRPGLAPLEELCGRPVIGVIPYRRDIRVDEEDALHLPGGGLAGAGELDICALKLPTVSNFTDLAPLAARPGLRLRWAKSPEELGNPDLLVLPGSKNTLYDLRWLRAVGLDRGVRAAAARHIPVLGLCGGYQMLGRRVREGSVTERGLELLPVETLMAEDKAVRPARWRTRGGWLLPPGLEVSGYEIHHGVTAAADALFDGPGAEGDGAIAGLVAGTYLHGLFDSEALLAALIGRLRARKGLSEEAPAAEPDRMAHYDRLADLLEAHLDLGRVGLQGPAGPGRRA